MAASKKSSSEPPTPLMELAKKLAEKHGIEWSEPVDALTAFSEAESLVAGLLKRADEAEARANAATDNVSNAAKQRESVARKLEKLGRDGADDRVEVEAALTRTKAELDHELGLRRIEADERINAEKLKNDAEKLKNDLQIEQIKADANRKIEEIRASGAARVEGVKGKYVLLAALVTGLVSGVSGYVIGRKADPPAVPQPSSASASASASVAPGSLAWQQDDYIRLFFLAKDAQVSGKIGRVEAERVFVAPTSYFQGSHGVEWTIGTAADALASERKDERHSEDAVLMRCRPAAGILKAQRATWSAVFDELTSKTVKCSNSTLSDLDKLRCVAAQIRADDPQTDATLVLANMFVQAGKLRSADSTRQLELVYGLKSAFSGTGYAVAGSGGTESGYKQVDVLDAMKIPEYWVLNKSLSEASCKCVRVTPFPERHQRRFDPDWIWEEGDQFCKRPDKL